VVAQVSTHQGLDFAPRRTGLGRVLDRLRPHYGALYYVVGAAHVGVAIVQFRHEWADLFRDGFFNVIDERGAPYQALGYWYLILAPVLCAAGSLAQAHLNATGTLPRAFSLTVVAVSIAAGLAMYENGIWAVGLFGLLGLAYARPAQETDQAASASAPTTRKQFVV
jgi:hypothetical protein